MNRNIDIFVPTEVAGIQLNNRIIRSATHEGMADEAGAPTEKLIRTYEALAKGGIGCIITGYAGVIPEGKAIMPGMNMIDSDDKIKVYAELVHRVHAAGSPIILQIAHCGRNGVAGKKANVNHLSETEIEQIIAAFIKAAVRANAAGFDGVQLHAAHGYLLSEFLSPHTNHRKDKWGGSEEKRFRIIGEIIKGIRAEDALKSYPIFIKINGSEHAKDGIKPEMAASIARRIQDASIDAIEVSRSLMSEGIGLLGGDVPVDMICNCYPGFKSLPGFVKICAKPVIRKLVKTSGSLRMYNVPAAQIIKRSVHIPVIAVGGIHDLADIKTAINDKGIDLVSMCRPLILEPKLISKYKEGKTQTAKCRNCNNCMIGIFNQPVRCYYSSRS